MAFSQHSDRKVAELRATGREFLKEFYGWGDYPTYRVHDAEGNCIGTEWYAYDVVYADENDQEGRRVETIFTNQRQWLEYVLDRWRPADRDGQDLYCRLAGETRRGVYGPLPDVA